MHQSLPNTVDYLEMPSTNLAATKEFFSGLFGWKFQDYGPDYSSFDDGRTTGGFFTSDVTSTVGKGAPLVVFYSPDLEKMAKEVPRLGGRIIRDIFKFPGGRRFHLRLRAAASSRSGRNNQRDARVSLVSWPGAGRNRFSQALIRGVSYEIIGNGGNRGV